MIRLSDAWKRACEVREMRDRCTGHAIEQDRMAGEIDVLHARLANSEATCARLTHRCDEVDADLAQLLAVLDGHTHDDPFETQCPVCAAISHINATKEHTP